MSAMTPSPRLPRSPGLSFGCALRFIFPRRASLGSPGKSARENAANSTQATPSLDARAMTRSSSRRTATRMPFVCDGAGSSARRNNSAPVWSNCRPVSLLISRAGRIVPPRSSQVAARTAFSRVKRPSFCVALGFPGFGPGNSIPVPGEASACRTKPNAQQEVSVLILCFRLLMACGWMSGRVHRGAYYPHQPD